MKLIITVFVLSILLHTYSIAQTTYFVDAANGNDNNNGTSSSMAWKTISKINRSTFNTLQGSVTIAFKKGGIWRETLYPPNGGTDENKRLIFTSYGEGRKPRILGSNDARGSSSDWSSYSTNVWRRVLNGSDQIFFEKDNVSYWGDDVNVSQRLTYTNNDGVIDNPFEYQWNGGYLYVFSPSNINPVDYYDAIEVAARGNAIDIENDDYITIDDIEIAYTKFPCETISGRKADFFKLTRCEIHHVGNVSRTGGSGAHWIYFTGTNGYIAYNKAYESCDHGFYVSQWTGSEPTDNWIFEHNYTGASYYSNYDLSNAYAQTNASDRNGNFDIRYNTITDSGKQINHGTGAGIQCLGSKSGSNVAPFSDIRIYDNIIYGFEWSLNGFRMTDSVYIYNNTILSNNNRAIYWNDEGTNPNSFAWIYNNILVTTNYSQVLLLSSTTNKFIDYNLWFNFGGATGFYVDGRTKSFTQWQNDYGFDNNGYNTNPLFKQFTTISSYKDLTIQSNSSCVDNGISLNDNYKWDFDGILRPQGDRWDIGAYEIFQDTINDTQDVNENIPNEFNLFQNFPNPFNPSTTIKFSIPIKQLVTIEVFNIAGEKVSLLTEQEYNPGAYSVVFNGTNLSSGVYLYGIQTPNYMKTLKMTLLK